jgi:hypothetical protein
MQSNSVITSCKGLNTLCRCKRIVVTVEDNVRVNNEELIVTTEYRTPETKCRINRCCNRVRLYSTRFLLSLPECYSVFRL